MDGWSMEVDANFETSTSATITDNSSSSQLPETSAIAWGNTLNGELGLGVIEEEHVSSPTEINCLAKIKSISCGDSHTLFVLEDGTLWSTGSNDHGQLGHDKDHSTLQKVEGLEVRSIVAASAGFAHNLVIDAWGTLFSWGSDSHGQTGLQIESQEKLINRPRVVKSLATKTVVQVSAGHFHSVVLTNSGEIFTCGSNSHGQLGLGYANGPNQKRFCQVEVLLGFPTALIVAGGFHSFALSVSGSVYGWGRNNYGQLGVGDIDDKCQPMQLNTLRSLGIKYITAGADHSAFLTQDGGVFTCGSSMYGQLGHNTFSSEVLPRKILEFGSIVSQIACGRCHTLCLTGDRLYSFGLGSSGQLGSPGGNKNSPMHIKGLSYIHSTYAGGDQSFVIVKVKTGISNTNLQSCDYRVYDSSKQMLTITEDCVNQFCSAVEPVDQDIMTYAEVLFASPSCWNASFLVANGGPCTWKNIGVDLNLAESVLSKLNTVKSQSLKELIDQLTYNELLPKLPHQLQHVEILRVYVLLPLLPTFYSGVNQMLPIYFAERLQSMSQKMIIVVISWLFNSPLEQIVRMISVYKKTIISVLESSRSSVQKDQTCRNCLNFLSLLNNLNKNTMKLSYHTFTIPQLSSKIEIRLDYFKWLSQKNQKSSFAFCDFPFVFDSQAKTLLLQTDQALQMQTAMNQATSQLRNYLMFPLMDPHEVQYLVLNVSRNNIVHDVINQLQNLNTHDLKKPVKVKFSGEEAEDAGGVRKEFFLLLMKEILDPKYGMFKNYDDSRLMWFNDHSFEDDIMYFLIGLLCGLAIYNFTIINLPFPLALYKKILDEKVDLYDLKELNPTVARSLEQLLDYTGGDLEAAFCLNFEISRESFGEVKIVPLKSGGSDIPVTQENKHEFVDLYVNYVMNYSVEKQFEQFKAGFQRVCGSTILQLFHSQELQAMVTGNEDYDWGELERNCVYKGGYHVNDPVIIRFWEVFHSLTIFEKKQFLLFLTGSDRIPILGMKSLKLCIQPTGDERYLPVAHTCFNLLDLPRYQTKERMKYKLTQAIQQNQGFSLV